MRLIKPSYEIIPQQSNLDGIYNIIEQAGRTCYKSEDKITPDSAKSFVARMIKSNHCYTGETEIFTEKGWIKFKNYLGEKVGVINKDCSFKRFETPSRVIKHSYEGNFYKYPSMGIEVTDGHNMFGVFRDSKNDFYNNSNYSIFKCNNEFKDSNGKSKTLGERMFKTPKHCIKQTYSDPYGELIGFWLGDGCYSTCKNKLVFHLKKERKVKYLEQLCFELGYIFKKRKSNYYDIIDDNIGSSFNSLFYNNGKKISLSYFPSVNIGHSIIKGLINSDGSLGVNTKTITFTNTSKSIINWLLCYAPICGYTISNLGVSKITNSKSPLYKVLLLDTNYTINNDSRNTDTKVIITNKKEDVFCVTVSTGLIMVRGENKVTSICGNCAMLEHGTVYLNLPLDKTYYNKNKYSKSSIVFYDGEDNFSGIFVTTNLRVLVENDWLDDLQYICEPTEYHEKRISVRFICDIGVSREYNRHRVDSIAEQSTRYCNFTKDKFNNEINYIIPSWITEEEINKVPKYITQIDIPNDEFGTLYEKETSSWSALNWWLWSLACAELAYIKMVNLGWTPQQARDVLPLSTKTDLIHTTFVSDWKHFFELRDCSKAHPQAFELANPLHEEFKKLQLI